jgi:hypothetical protein
LSNRPIFVSLRGRSHRPGEFDEPVSFDRRGAINGAFGFGDLLIDTVQGAPGPVMALLVMNRPVGDPAGLLTTAGGPRLSQHETVRDGLAGVVVAPFAHHIGRNGIRAPMNDNP